MKPHRIALAVSLAAALYPHGLRADPLEMQFGWCLSVPRQFESDRGKGGEHVEVRELADLQGGRRDVLSCSQTMAMAYGSEEVLEIHEWIDPKLGRTVRQQFYLMLIGGDSRDATLITRAVLYSDPNAPDSQPRTLRWRWDPWTRRFVRPDKKDENGALFRELQSLLDNGDLAAARGLRWSTFGSESDELNARLLEAGALRARAQYRAGRIDDAAATALAALSPIRGDVRETIGKGEFVFPHWDDSAGGAVPLLADRWSIEVMNDLAFFLQEAGEHTRALEVLAQVLRLAPARAVAWLNAGDSLWATGKLDEARAHYRRYLELKGEKVRAPERVEARLAQKANPAVTPQPSRLQIDTGKKIAEALRKGQLETARGFMIAGKASMSESEREERYLDFLEASLATGSPRVKALRALAALRAPPAVPVPDFGLHPTPRSKDLLGRAAQSLRAAGFEAKD